MKSPKDLITLILATGLCAYAIAQQLQIIAVIAFFTIVAVMYKRAASRAINLFLNIFSRTTQAKYGSVELTISGNETVGSLLDLKSAPTWIQGVLSKMMASHLGFIMTMRITEKMAVTKAQVTQLRELRDLGLIEHDQPSLSDSTTVWLSNAGIELANYLDKTSSANQQP